MSNLPFIDTRDTEWRTIDVEGSICPDGRIQLNFRARYRAPNELAIAICDARDNTPLFISVNGRSLVYDPIDMSVLHAEQSESALMIGLLGDSKLGMKLQWNLASANDRRLVIDLRSLYSRGIAMNSLTKTGSQEFQFTQITKSGGEIVSKLAPTAAFQFRGVEVTQPDGDSPAFVIKKLITNTDIPDEAFALPTLEQLQNRVRVRKVDSGNEVEATVELENMIKGCYARLAVTQSHIRTLVQNTIAKTIDWNALNSADTVYSSVLRDIAK